MRLIDADEAREKMLKLLDHHLMMCNYSADSATQDCIEVINEADVVDAEPVRHGHWIDGTCGCYKICSECDQISDFDFDYCPHCGAKMFGGVNNENK